MDIKTQRILYTIKLKANYWNLTTGRNLTKDLQAVDKDTLTFIVETVNSFFRKQESAEKLAEIVKFYAVDALELSKTA